MKAGRPLLVALGAPDLVEVRPPGDFAPHVYLDQPVRRPQPTGGVQESPFPARTERPKGGVGILRLRYQTSADIANLPTVYFLDLLFDLALTGLTGLLAFCAAA